MLPTVLHTDCFVFKRRNSVPFIFTNVYILFFYRWERGYCAGLNWNSVWSVGCREVCKAAV